jgi:hypothetical protein
MIKFNKDFMAGAVVGFGAGLATRYLNEKGSEPLREAAKNALRWGTVSYRTFREQIGQFKENLEDLVAEANSEVNSNGRVESTPTESSDVKAAS